MENREVKSDTFSLLMQEKKYALDVYNALNGSEYADPELIDIMCIEGGISLSLRNDASFIIRMELNIYEHQSTFSPNMPFRQFVYSAELYKNFVKETKQDPYSRKKIIIPNPRFVVFYNGNEKRPEKEILKLSDLYAHSENNHELELVCTVYNINPNNNEEFMNRCKTLSQYTAFIEKVRENELNQVERPIGEAITYCIENDILKEFFIEHRDEVLTAMVLDMTFAAREPLIREEGRQEGIKEGRIICFVELYKEGSISRKTAIAKCGISEAEFDELVEKYTVSQE